MTTIKRNELKLEPSINSVCPLLKKKIIATKE